MKGQLVIPRWLRDEYGIEEGTRAVVEAIPEGILIKPVTKARIRKLRGLLKRKSGERSLVEEWREHKAVEKALEEAKYGRLAGSR
ncbi:MAG: AbrB/MazE/SpoVT family DNA-binding domain-containing protein [Verrucomicrobiae bacterium]|nr:AbrB/MazE/SpoVT family DNA-binding domain-containing protein [Verrucomicrobiae bacterium]